MTDVFRLLLFSIAFYLGWKAAERYSNKREAASKKTVKRERVVPRIESSGFWRCGKCGGNFVFLNHVELENLIDRHVCRRVPV